MGLMGKIVRISLSVIGGLVALFLILLFWLWASGRVWYPRQRARVEQLEEQYGGAADTFTPASPEDRAREDRFAVTPLDDSRPLNTLRLIATHNSYHLEPGWLRRSLIGLAEPEEPAKLRYSHQTLWQQLDAGVRSFELDVRARANRFSITHVPLVDSRGPNPDFALTLREINLWSASHPGHVPIIILLELKSDWMFLDPGLKPWDEGTLARLDSLVRESFPPARLLTPEVVRGASPDMVTALSEEGWPALGDVRGRVMFVLHTNESIDSLYAAGDPALNGRPLFTSQPGSTPPGERRDALVVIHNEPDAESIEPFLAAGFLVRTRADGDGSHTAEQRAAALASGAQIVSTDLPPGHPNDPALGIVEFAHLKTLAQQP